MAQPNHGPQRCQGRPRLLGPVSARRNLRRSPWQKERRHVVGGSRPEGARRIRGGPHPAGGLAGAFGTSWTERLEGNRATDPPWWRAVRASAGGEGGGPPSESENCGESVRE